VHAFATLILSTAAVTAAMFWYERRVARPSLERLWGRVRSGEPPTPDPQQALHRRLLGWAPYLSGIVDSPASTREAQIAAVGVAMVVLFPVVVWIVLTAWLYVAL
jgi:hypothetical protein